MGNGSFQKIVHSCGVFAFVKLARAAARQDIYGRCIIAIYMFVQSFSEKDVREGVQSGAQMPKNTDFCIIHGCQ